METDPALSEIHEPARRPIASRSARPVQFLAARLGASPITPNQISVFSVIFALIAAIALFYWQSPFAFLIAALGIQLRLLCNLLDGMVAIEGGKKSAVGVIYNEFPDRIADSLFLIAAGYACFWPGLGWACALLAALTAYIRVFGGSLGLVQDFSGIMAKQRRMALLTIGLIAQFIEQIWFANTFYCLIITLFLIAAGSAATCMTRTISIARKLKMQG